MIAITNFWSFFFLAAALQGLFLSLNLILQKSANKGNIVLAPLIALFSVSIIDTVVFWIEYYKTNPHLLGISLSFIFIYGPLFYLYLSRMSSSKVIRVKQQWIHFLPVMGALIWYFPYYLSNAITKLDLITTWNNHIVNALILPFLGLLSLLLYTILSYGLIRKLEKKHEIRIIWSNHWLGLVFKSYGLFVVFHIIHFFNMLFGKSTRISDIIIALGYSIFIYSIGYLGLKTSKLLNGIKIDTTKYQTSSLPTNFSNEMFARLTSHIIANESFKNNEIKLTDLATELSLSPHQLSQIINQNANQNFSEFINSYRIKEALKLISQIDRIKQLADEVGFNNRTTFNKVFKKSTGLTPTEYKKIHTQINN